MRTGKFPQQSSAVMNSGVWQLRQKKSISSAVTSVVLNGLDDYTKLMLHFDGADAATTTVDAATLKTATFVGTAQLDTAQKKFGTASLLLDGNSDTITLLDSDDFAFGTENFSIDFWVRFNAVGVQQHFICQSQSGGFDSNNRWGMYIGASSQIAAYWRIGGVTVGSYYMSNTWSVATGIWYHITFERIGTTAKLFIDGISQSLTESVAFSTNDTGNYTGVLYIGAEAVPDEWFNGWIDEVRISKGITRWNSNFTTPTQNYGINGDDDVEYKLLAKHLGGPSNSVDGLKLRFNNDSGNNYGRQLLYCYDATIVSSRDSGNYISLSTPNTNNGYSVWTETFIYAKSGYIRTVINNWMGPVLTTSITYLMLTGESWSNTIDNITSIVIFNDTSSGLGIGTELELYTRRPTL